MKRLFRIAIIIAIIAIVAALVEFACDEAFWDSIPEVEEMDVYEGYDRL